MVLSLAFILAFIGAAVALLIGIIIFSEVEDALVSVISVSGLPLSQEFLDQDVGKEAINLSTVIVGATREIGTSSDTTSSTCSTVGANPLSATKEITREPSGSDGNCRGLMFAFDAPESTTGITNNAIINSMVMRFDITGVQNPDTLQIFQVTALGGSLSNQERYDTAFLRGGALDKSGNIYVTNSNVTLSNGNDKLVPLPQQAITDLEAIIKRQTFLTLNSLVMGFNFDDTTSRGASLSRIEFSSIPELLIDFTIPAIPAEQWDWQEQQLVGGEVERCDQVPPAIVGGTNLQIQNTDDSRALCYLFKVFEKTAVQDQTLEVTWGGSATGTSATVELRVQVLDGEYMKGSDFSLLTSLAQLHEVFETSNPFVEQTDTIPLTLAGSTLDKVTVAMQLRDNSVNSRPFMDIFEIDITGVGTWEFDSSATVNNENLGTDGFDFGLVTAGFTPATTSGVPPEFTQASSIAFTVIAVLPVAMFFFLFAIFGGRVE